MLTGSISLFDWLGSMGTGITGMGELSGRFAVELHDFTYQLAAGDRHAALAQNGLVAVLEVHDIIPHIGHLTFSFLIVSPRKKTPNKHNPIRK